MDAYWAAIDAALLELKTATTPEQVISLIHGSNDGHKSSGEAFWGGDGDDLLGALYDAGWGSFRYEAPYYWVVKSPDGSGYISYTEGDVDRGDNPSCGK